MNNSLLGTINTMTVEDLCSYNFEERMSAHLGAHVFAEFWDYKEAVGSLESIIREAAKKANAIVMKYSEAKFEPQGFTAFAILAESHISIHTWPEKAYCAIDIFTCGVHTKPGQALQYLKEQLQPEKIEINLLFRGKRPI